MKKDVLELMQKYDPECVTLEGTKIVEVEKNADLISKIEKGY
jgi:hypothetical protein